MTVRQPPARFTLVAAALWAVCGGCVGLPNNMAGPVVTASTARTFTEVAAAAGIAHVHHKPILDHQLDNIMAWVCSVGAAAAAGDYDNDGWIDLYVTDSRKGTPNHLYRNNGDGTFSDVAAQAGLADVNGEAGTSMDCVWGDYDNDGWIDLYVVRWGTDALFRNDGDGTFSDVTERCFRRRDGSLGTEWANGNAAVFWDYNLDGRLDLYVGNYFKEVDLWHLESTRIMHDDFEEARNGGHNYLYRQEPDGTFTEIAASLGVDDPGWTLAVGSADIDNDGWPDLYCADDFGPDQLFVNNRDGTLRNATATALGFDTKKGMNVDFGDFNNDGWLDIFVANITTAEYLQEGNMLWHNDGPGPDGTITLTDISLETGTYDGGWGWGAKFFDYDNDADLDIVGVNGFITAGKGNYWYDLASWTVTGQDSADAANWPAIGTRSFSGNEPIRLWRNDGLYSFTERAAELGVDSRYDGRGAVCFDYDNDGDLDLFVANHDQPPQLYRNDMDRENHWLIVALEADPESGINRDAVGARVTVVTRQGTQLREREGGNGYCGQSDPRLHFGLGSDDRVRLLEVRWPDGGLQYLEDVPADKIITVRQDSSRYATQLAIAVAPPKPWSRSKDGVQQEA
ncbi:MAG: CRTAC1 family protein, partial [Planctomycetota bacterium]